MMQLREVVGLALILAVYAVLPCMGKPMPGEPSARKALSPYPFPDRMTAFVWRNWGLVPSSRLATIVGASESDLKRAAGELGLDDSQLVLPEWRRKGYITLLRRNWHLLPYDQLLMLLDMTREELAFSLLEDDFLLHKLGDEKPQCEKLVWTPSDGANSAARRKIAATLQAEGVDVAAVEEPRFAFVKALSRIDGQVADKVEDSSPFDFRLSFSYFADYVDPLADDEISSYPEGLLQKLSLEGVNAVWLHAVLTKLACDPKYPEWGEGAEKRQANLLKLVERARKYGIKVYLYFNEPRSLTSDFFAHRPEREQLRGTAIGGEAGRVAMCTSQVETRRYLHDAIRQVFTACPGLGGIFTITMSENLTNCFSRRGERGCPRCAKRTCAETLAELHRAMIEGMHAASPEAEAIVYNWAWPKAEEEQIIAALPKDRVRVLAVSENGMKVVRGGVEAKEADYSISIVGPGDLARRTWALATTNGVGAVAKVQVSASWELSPFPYLPVMDLVAEHALNLAQAGVKGVMLSWSCGAAPSPNLRVYRELRRGENAIGPLLNRLSAALYGQDKVPMVRAAWKAFSDGFREYPFSCGVLYNAPQQWGPANLLYAKKTGYAATMVGIPYDDLELWRAQYPPEVFISQMDKVAKGFERGCELLEGVASAREINLYRAETMHFAAVADQARFVLARDRGDWAAAKTVARRELERAKAYLPLIRADSRIGYEPSNHYFALPRDVMEKILSCRVVLDEF